MSADLLQTQIERKKAKQDSILKEMLFPDLFNFNLPGEQ